MNVREIEPAVGGGAELVLSVNSSNREAAADWGCEVVAVPDDPATLAGLDETVEFLAEQACRCGSIRSWSRSALALPPAWAAIWKCAAAIPTPR